MLAAACSDRAIAPPSEMPLAAPPVATSDRLPVELARLVAKGLKNPAFRAYLKAQLDASPFREHKLQFETFLNANSGHAARAVGKEGGTTPESVPDQARTAIALEVYFPVPAHREAWTGDENVLVATALKDDEPPVAVDPEGRRYPPGPKTPRATPVLAIVPVETDFSWPPARLACILDCDTGGTSGGGTPPPPPPPGLYMTQSHFVQDFEGWLKGSPEFEVHILGQKGQTDSLIDYQCAGEHAGGPYAFDQNDLDWSGRVLLFSQQQADEYNAAHPNQNMRVFVVEDDDTACQIKTDPTRFQHLVSTVDSAYQNQTSGNDSSTVITKSFGYARSAFNIWQALASLIKTNDDLVGNGVKDEIVGAYYPGYNWFVKGDNNITNGWINLVMY